MVAMCCVMRLCGGEVCGRDEGTAGGRVLLGHEIRWDVEGVGYVRGQMTMLPTKSCCDFSSPNHSIERLQENQDNFKLKQRK
jgi:hypothetical protein